MVFSRVSAALKVLMDPSWSAEIGMMANLSPKWKNKSSRICFSHHRLRKKRRKELEIKMINEDHNYKIDIN